MIKTGISGAAAVHVAVAKSDVITKVDLDRPSLCVFNPVDGGVIFNESGISVTDTPVWGLARFAGWSRFQPDKKHNEQCRHR